MQEHGAAGPYAPPAMPSAPPMPVREVPRGGFQKTPLGEFVNPSYQSMLGYLLRVQEEEGKVKDFGLGRMQIKFDADAEDRLQTLHRQYERSRQNEQAQRAGDDLGALQVPVTMLLSDLDDKLFLDKRENFEKVFLQLSIVDQLSLLVPVPEDHNPIKPEILKYFRRYLSNCWDQGQQQAQRNATAADAVLEQQRARAHAAGVAPSQPAGSSADESRAFRERLIRMQAEKLGIRDASTANIEELEKATVKVGE